MKCQHVILAWFGNEEPSPDHPLHDDTDTFMCYWEDEQTQCATEPLMWLKHVVLKCGRGKCILELYSQCGMSQCS